MAAYTFAPVTSRTISGVTRYDSWLEGRTPMPTISDDGDSYMDSSRSYITSITFTDIYDGPYHAKWDGSEDKDGTVMVYVYRTKMTIASGVEGGKLYTNNDASSMFGYLKGDGFVNVTEINGLEFLDTSKTTNMTKMFQACIKVKELDLSNFNVENVTSMKQMFMSNSTVGKMALENIIGIDGWDVSKVTDFSSMFTYCSKLKKLNLAGWNVSNNCVNIKQMFHMCGELESIGDIGNWDVSNVTDMSNIWSGCSKLKELNLRNWNNRKATNVSGMFNGTTGINDAMYCLEKLTVGSDFKFEAQTGTKSIPSPSDTYIPGADGKWYTSGCKPYTVSDISSYTANTYYASKSIVRNIKALIRNGVIIDIAGFIRNKTGRSGLKTSDFIKNLSLILDSSVTDSKFFDITPDGIVSLKSQYRGCPTPTDEDEYYEYAKSDNGFGLNGSDIDKLPERIVFPESIGGIIVKGFQPGMFQCNNRVREIVFCNTVSHIPEAFCLEAKNLHTIGGTDSISAIGAKAFCTTRLKEALFPNLLGPTGSSAFKRCIVLHTVDIGDIMSIPSECFSQCISLNEVRGGFNVTTIGSKAFWATYDLKNLDNILNNVTELGERALWMSRVEYDWDALETRIDTSEWLFCHPTWDNYHNSSAGKYWENCFNDSYVCENRIVTVLDQSNPAWRSELFGNCVNKHRIYGNGCGIFAIIHVLSALSGKDYTSPFIFERELSATGNKALLTDDPSDPTNTKKIFAALGYNADLYFPGYYPSNYPKLGSDDVERIYKALSSGSYVIINKSADFAGSDGNLVQNGDGGHAVVLYGVGSDGEFLIADSSTGCRHLDIWNDKDLLLYKMPVQNLFEDDNWYMIVSKKS